MKKNFSNPEIKIELFPVEDVITASSDLDPNELIDVAAE